LSGSFLLWLFYSSIPVFYRGSKLSATESSASSVFRTLGSEAGAGGVSSFPRESIHSVSLGQLLGEIAVVGSHLALSGQSRHGQSTMVAIDAGSLFG
jgi:hypothetical protein